MKSLYIDAKDVFLDTVNAKEYVQSKHTSRIYQSLKDSIINKPSKIILLYGNSGTGKSMFLNKLYTDISTSQPTFFYKTPILSESEFYQTLAQDLCHTKYCEELNFTQFVKIIEQTGQKQIPIVLLDEAQLYSETIMEEIRLLSDRQMVKFVITLRKIEKKSIIAQEHFQTRIWKTIKLENTSYSELKIYIQKKLTNANCFDNVKMFTNRAVNKIYKITNGNYRDTNKLLYTLFDLCYHYEKSNRSSSVKTDQISNKVIEIAAIQAGLING